MNSLVSIDWDFFIPHGMFEDVTFPDGKVMPGLLVYDWQMSETRPAAFEMEVWKIRAFNFHRWGLDIDKLTYPPLLPADFALEVSARMGDDAMPMAWRADSHAWGTILSRDMNHSGPINVINFDAHHDLSYIPDPLAHFKATGNLSCDNWVLIGLDQGWIKNYTLVYPDWLGRKEWMPIEKNIKPWRKQIEVTTWSEWLTSGAEIPNPEMLFFCRSSSWTPPWLDAGFQSLYEEFGYAGCLDCELKHKGPYDTCEHREWDWEEMAVEFQQRQRHLDEITALASKITPEQRELLT